MKLLEPEVPWVGDQEIADDEVVFSATREELAGLAGALNEALEAVEGWEFQTRLGITPEEARALRQRIGEVLRGAFRPQ
ncbi:hypothetical protein SAMN05421595_0703 [Austwickia chelonae]|uniref:Uncharacterized protein n=1 Tax=Austwickia chelonae NBRC 105200 TaxID=1184607 RepID=K6W8N4_9MICO|nr:hypothetical protein [Austwickia chelonae]GAB78182.1 hypothetical protein AUCHE_08_04270 [Austwickia chelonae NBRC 105200]SEV98356.1 hypothetical protein SAMN05421595_0703 [Austwickia chelonae]